MSDQLDRAVLLIDHCIRNLERYRVNEALLDARGVENALNEVVKELANGAIA